MHGEGCESVEPSASLDYQYSNIWVFCKPSGNDKSLVECKLVDIEFILISMMNLLPYLLQQLRNHNEMF